MCWSRCSWVRTEWHNFSPNAQGCSWGYSTCVLFNILTLITRRCLLCFCCSVLVTHNDTVKISDFGTSKELSDKSTKMSFAGTVAWMAPEVIRNEPVSEKVDIWWVSEQCYFTITMFTWMNWYIIIIFTRSFGVVLWELLTGEIPYKDVDSSAIIWGVGSNSLHLPVPSTCPDGFKILMKQTWWSFITEYR